MGSAICKNDTATRLADNEILMDPIVQDLSEHEPQGPREENRDLQHTQIQENDEKDLAWMNHCLAHLWPEMELVAQHIVEHTVMPKVREKTPLTIQEVKFSHFSLGQHAPVLGPIQSSSLDRGVSRIRCTLDYKSDLFMEITIVTQVASVACGIKNLKVQGDLVITMDPYAEAPGHSGPTGGVSVYFLNEPNIDFEFSGSASILASIGMKKIVLYALRIVMSSKLVTPNIITQLVSLTDFTVYPLAFQSPSPIGVLRVTLQQARITPLPKPEEDSKQKSRGLAIVKKMRRASETVFEWVDDRLGYMVGVDTDPYVKLAIGTQVWTPKAKHLGATFDFPIFDPEQTLQISGWDRDLVGDDDLLGELPPYTMKGAMAHSEKPLQIVGPEGEQFGFAQFKLEWLLATQGVLSPGGCMVILCVGELRQAGDNIKDKEFVVRRMCNKARYRQST